MFVVCGSGGDPAGLALAATVAEAASLILIVSFRTSTLRKFLAQKAAASLGLRGAASPARLTQQRICLGEAERRKSRYFSGVQGDGRNAPPPIPSSLPPPAPGQGQRSRSEGGGGGRGEGDAAV